MIFGAALIPRSLFPVLLVCLFINITASDLVRSAKERTRHPRTWPCIPKLSGQLFPDLVLAVSIIEACPCIIEAGALDETKAHGR